MLCLFKRIRFNWFSLYSHFVSFSPPPPLYNETEINKVKCSIKKKLKKTVTKAWHYLCCGHGSTSNQICKNVRLFNGINNIRIRVRIQRLPKFGPGSFKAQNAAFFQTKKQCDIRLEFCINFKHIYPP